MVEIRARSVTVPLSVRRIIFDENPKRLRWTIRVPATGGGTSIAVAGTGPTVTSSSSCSVFAGDILDIDGPSAQAGVSGASVGADTIVEVMEFFL